MVPYLYSLPGYAPTTEAYNDYEKHIQGYFSNYLSTRQRKELSEVILNYRFGTLPLLAPLTLLKHYLGEYPNDYLLTQNYFDPYPEELALRLMVN
nr:DUF1722 domain-containing protein [Escherichia coli]